MGESYIESHTVLMRHRKVVDLAKSLRLRKAYVIGHLHALWHAALEQQENGDLTKWSDEFIAEVSDFPGDAPQYVRLLQEAGWLDGKLIHDWLDIADRYLIAKYRTAKPEKLVEIWKIHGKDYLVRLKADSSQTLVGPDKTRSDKTIKHVDRKALIAKALEDLPDGKSTGK